MKQNASLKEKKQQRKKISKKNLVVIIMISSSFSPFILCVCYRCYLKKRNSKKIVKSKKRKYSWCEFVKHSHLTFCQHITKSAFLSLSNFLILSNLIKIF